MITTEDLADLTLHHMGRTGFQPFVVVIGAMDGVSFDDFHGYLTMYQWSGLFVEPIPEQFRRLQGNHVRLGSAGGNRYENCAIAEHDGTIQMLTINQDAVDAGTVHPCFGGMSTIYPPRNGLASPEDAGTVAAHGELVEVACLTLPTLFRRHAVDRVDVLCLDAEGWDYRILRQLDFAAYRPKLIRCEYINLTPEEQAAIVHALADHAYVIHIAGQNLDAVAREYWQELNAAPAAATVAAAYRPNNLTLVTSVFDLSAGQPDVDLRCGFGLYLDRVKALLNVPSPMVIFAPPELDELIWRFRARASTHIVHRSLADLRAFPFAARVEEIRTSVSWLDRGGGMRRHLTCRMPLYAPFALSKQFFLNDAALYNPFRTEYFVWLDGDIAGAIGDPAAQLTRECERHLTALLSDRRMLYGYRPLDERSDVAGFDRGALAELTGRAPRHLVSGRMFGGSAKTIQAINGIYYGHLGHSLSAGRLASEDQVLTMISATHRALCHLQPLEAGKQWRGFFERLQHGVPNPAPLPT